MKYDGIIKIWGVFDLLAIAWYLLWQIIHGQLPFYTDISTSIATAGSLGRYCIVIVPVLSLVIYVSFLFSGSLLIRKKRAGAILSYIQTPFRLLAVVPPSIFYITWPLKFIFKDPKAISAVATLIILLIISEILKVYTVVAWQRAKRFV